jgi:hypothetical protein
VDQMQWVVEEEGGVVLRHPVEESQRLCNEQILSPGAVVREACRLVAAMPIDPGA